MRSPLLVALLILQVSDSYSIFAADPAKEPELRGQTPFTSQSGEASTNRLFLILVTNDDAFLDRFWSRLGAFGMLDLMFQGRDNC